MPHSATHSNDATTVNSSTWRMLAWGGVVLQGLAFVAVLLIQQWTGAMSLGIFFVTSLAFLLMRDHVPSLISLAVVVAALINAFGWAWDLFHLFIWYDELVHSFTGFAGMAALSYWSRNSFPPAGSAGFIVKAAIWGLGLGILWEIAEAMFLDLTLLDTLVDLVMDTIGGAVGGWFAGWAIRQQNASSGAVLRA